MTHARRYGPFRIRILLLVLTLIAALYFESMIRSCEEQTNSLSPTCERKILSSGDYIVGIDIDPGEWEITGTPQKRNWTLLTVYSCWDLEEITEMEFLSNSKTIRVGLEAGNLVDIDENISIAPICNE